MRWYQCTPDRSDSDGTCLRLRPNQLGRANGCGRRPYESRDDSVTSPPLLCARSARLRLGSTHIGRMPRPPRLTPQGCRDSRTQNGNYLAWKQSRDLHHRMAEPTRVMQKHITRTHPGLPAASPTPCDASATPWTPHPKRRKTRAPMTCSPPPSSWHQSAPLCGQSSQKRYSAPE